MSLPWVESIELVSRRNIVSYFPNGMQLDFYLGRCVFGRYGIIRTTSGNQHKGKRTKVRMTSTKLSPSRTVALCVAAVLTMAPEAADVIGTCGQSVVRGGCQEEGWL